MPAFQRLVFFLKHQDEIPYLEPPMSSPALTRKKKRAKRRIPEDKLSSCSLRLHFGVNPSIVTETNNS